MLVRSVTRIITACVVIAALLNSAAVPIGADAIEPRVTPVVSVEGGVEFLGGAIYGPPQMSGDTRYIVYREGPDSETVRWLDRTTGTDSVVAEGVAAGGPSISMDGQWVAFVDYGVPAVRLWSAASGTTATLSEPGATFDAIAPSVATDGGRVLWNETRSGDEAVRIWNSGSGTTATYPGRDGQMSGDGSHFVYVPAGSSQPQLVEVATGDSVDVGFVSDLSDDGSSIGVRTAPRGVAFTDRISGATVSVDLPDDLQLNIPLALISGDGAFGFFNTNQSVVPEDGDDGFDPYRVELETETIAVIDGLPEGTIIDVSTDGMSALYWSRETTPTGFELSIIDLSPEPPPVPVARVVSPRLSDQVARLYQAFFLRDADAAGLSFWIDQRANGRSLGSVAEQFARSPEFVARYGALSDEGFVDLIYQNVQGRPGDPEGRAFWIGQLAAGVTRGQVMVGFSESEEFIRTTDTSTPTDPRAASVWRLYRAYYLRNADQGGFDFWYQRVLDGQTLVSVSNSFAAAPEFSDLYGELSDDDFVAQIYDNVLQRSPDEAGLAFWREQMRSGVSRGQVMLEFSESPEFIIRTDTLPPR